MWINSFFKIDVFVGQGEGGGGYYFGSFIVKYIIVVKFKFILIEVDIKFLERLFVL